MDSRKILIVDDEPAFTRLLKLNLESTAGYAVWEENEGTEAVETARRVKPDIILLDLIMPKAAGSVIASQLRSDPKLAKTPIVFLTAVVPKEKATAHRDLAGFPFIAKPIETQEIIYCIETNITEHGWMGHAA